MKNKKLYLLDMDGTIYHEDKLIDGAKEFLELLKKQNKDYIFITNNSSKSVEEYIKKIKSFGIEVTEDNFFTSAQASIEYIKALKKNIQIYLIGTKAFEKELIENKITIVKNIEKEHVDILLVGFDTELNYEKIINGSKVLYKGAKFLATNPDYACPVKNNEYIPDCGAICEMLKLGTGFEPFYLGKPRKELVEIILNKRKINKKEVIVIGDRLYTDIACGINANVETGLVLTGEAKKEDLQETKYKPTYVFSSIKDIIKELI